MSENKEELKNKIIYRASYRGSKEMDILMSNFVNSLITTIFLFSHFSFISVRVFKIRWGDSYIIVVFR